MRFCLINSISFVVIFGLFHGVCVLPVILSLIGPEDIHEDGVNDIDEAGKGKQSTFISDYLPKAACTAMIYIY